MDHGREVGRRVAKNPWCAVLDAADGQLQRYSARFGLTPADRAQLRPEPDRFDEDSDLLTGG